MPNNEDGNVVNIKVKSKVPLEVKRAYHRAVELGKQGIPCFPCRENKAPACPGGFKTATVDQKFLLRLWRRNPGSLVGVRTGVCSGLSVLDIDVKNGGLDWLDANKQKLPKTRIHKTRGSGYHYIFKHPEGLRNSDSQIAPGVDIRAEGGYVIWWPAAGLQIVDESAFTDWPEWLLPQISNVKIDEPITTPLRNEVIKKNIGDLVIFNHQTRRGVCALYAAANIVARAKEGSRNETFNKQLWSVLDYVMRGELDLPTVVELIGSAARHTGLSPKEIIATFSSALRKRGLSNEKR